MRLQPRSLDVHQGDVLVEWDQPNEIALSIDDGGGACYGVRLTPEEARKVAATLLWAVGDGR